MDLKVGDEVQIDASHDLNHGKRGIIKEIDALHHTAVVVIDGVAKLFGITILTTKESK